MHFTIVLSVNALTTCIAQIGIMTHWNFKIVFLDIWTWTHVTIYVSNPQQPHGHGMTVLSPYASSLFVRPKTMKTGMTEGVDQYSEEHLLKPWSLPPRSVNTHLPWTNSFVSRTAQLNPSYVELLLEKFRSRAPRFTFEASFYAPSWTTFRQRTESAVADIAPLGTYCHGLKQSNQRIAG